MASMCLRNVLKIREGNCPKRITREPHLKMCSNYDSSLEEIIIYWLPQLILIFVSTNLLFSLTEYYFLQLIITKYGVCSGNFKC